MTAFLLSNSQNLLAQTATTTSETGLNQQLLDNAKASREAIEKKEADAPKQEIRYINAAQGKGKTNTNLTDHEKQLSENYIHQGKANALVEATCTGDMKSVCAGQEGKHKFLGLDPNLVKAVSQAYAMFGALAGDSLGAIKKGPNADDKKSDDKKTDAKSDSKTADTKTDTKTDAKTDEAKAGDKKEENASDYCKFIPTATEGIATAVQVAQTKSMGEEIGNGDTAQKDALLKAAKSHSSRAKMAQVQAAGWFGGAACYGVNAAMGQFAVDKNLAIKMGAATLLGAFYQNEVSANKGYADKIKKLADSLPGKGDCNPITDNVCYCSQPSTENDPTYCMPGLHKKNLNPTSYRMACTDNNLKLDPTCSCEKSNSCFDTLIETQSEGIISLGDSGYGGSVYSSIRPLARGELVGGTLNSSSYDKTAAIAKKALADINSRIPGNSNLTKDQKGLMDAITSKGIPANIASLMASNPPSAAAMNAVASKFSGASGESGGAAAPARSNIIDFSGGNGLGYKGNTKESGGNGAEELLAKLKPNQKGAINSKILEFAKRAENQAQSGQIRKEKDTPLFDIISMRYQTSGRRLLQVDVEN